MKKNNFKHSVNNPNLIQNNEVNKLQELLIEKPYFQTGQLLLAKGLLNTNSVRYNKQLKKAAAFCLEREKLFSLISLNTESKKVKEENPNMLNVGNPLIFDENDSHSFSEWLSISKIKKIDREKEIKKNNPIEDFIEKNIKITKPKRNQFFKPTNEAKKSLIENTDLITPTLAKVYLEQGHYDKAILAYTKLCLKYPKKSSFFASQIKLINKLKKE
jgi:hypothetical protein